MSDASPCKPVVWVGSGFMHLREFPNAVQDHRGYALYVAQQGGRHLDTKILTGFGGAAVVEIIKDAGIRLKIEQNQLVAGIE